MKVNFKQFPMYEGIKKDIRVASDISDGLSDLLYSKVAGVGAHLLSEKIYQAGGEIDLTEKEINIITGCKGILPGIMVDSWNKYIEENRGGECHEN